MRTNGSKEWQQNLVRGLGATLLMAAFASAVPAATPRASTTATPDALFTLYFARCGPGWTGGDSAFSARLTNDQVAWMFSDSAIGRVDESGQRDNASARAIQGNVLVIQDLRTGAFTSYLTEDGGMKGRPSGTRVPYDNSTCPGPEQRPVESSQAFFQHSSCIITPTSACRLWSGDMLVENGYLRVFLRRIKDSYQWDGTFIGSIKADLTEKPSVLPAPCCLNQVAYGAALLPSVLDSGKSYTYVYGTRNDSPGITSMHLARVPTGSLTDNSKWEYYGSDNGKNGWTTNASKTVPLGPKVPPEFSVTKVADCGRVGKPCYVMIGHEPGFLIGTKLATSGKIMARFATSPTGPWSDPPTLIYKTPETNQPNLYTYNSHLHSEFPYNNGFLVSYNVNSNDFASAYQRADIGAPRFIRVQFNWPR